MTERAGPTWVYAPEPDHDHVHDHDHDHDHDVVLPLEDNPIWQQDNVELTSVGVDVGSSGTQILFSRLHLRRIGEDLSSRYIVVNRETIHRSPVALTPYAEGLAIDAEVLGGLVDRAYAAARLRPEQIDTGVVILTGEALRRENAKRIADILADRAGDLVTATAGHHMEARLAAFGSGAARASYDEGVRLLNVDIGGGTTKLAVVEQGSVLETAALHVGGRLVVVADGRIVRLEPAGRRHAARAGLDWDLGSEVTDDDLRRVAAGMADAILAAIAPGPPPEDVRELFLTSPLTTADFDGVQFSGGVAEYVYATEAREFGDLGRWLGVELRERFDRRRPGELRPAGERIRATALGASEYSIQLSGNTTFVSDPDALLPRRNLQVLRPAVGMDEHAVDEEAMAVSIREALELIPEGPIASEVVLALPWRGLPTHPRLAAFGRGVVAGMSARLSAGRPLYLVVDGDVAMNLGALLRDELAVEVPLLVLDGVRLWDFDYVDLGRVRHPSNTVPVTIKSLVFENDPRGGQRLAAVDG